MKRVARKFHTNYYVTDPEKYSGRSTYSSYVWATSLAHARKLCKMRGLGERVFTVSRKRKPDTATVPGYGNKHLAHWVSFLGFVALKAGYTAEQTFGDLGILHELIHADSGIYNYRKALKQEILDRYHKLCRNLGFLPPTERYVQLQNPRSKEWTRVDTTTGAIVGHRKKPYKCAKAT